MYCPTEKIITDFFTKPLQGCIFKTFRNARMDYDMKDFVENHKKHEMKNKGA